MVPKHTQLILQMRTSHRVGEVFHPLLKLMGGFFLDFWLLFCLSPLKYHCHRKLETVHFFVSEQMYKFNRESIIFTIIIMISCPEKTFYLSNHIPVLDIKSHC